MARQAAVGVDVTAHKEERDAADARRKTRMRARYYVELVVGSRHADHTRLGFSGTFKALLALHQAFARTYLDKHGDGGRASAAWTHRRESASSSSSSTASQSSVSSASSSTMKRFFKQAFALNSSGRRSGSGSGGGAVRSEPALSARGSLDQLHHPGWSASSVPSLPPFPAQHKMLVRLEGDGSKDDAKVEARAAALFEYYSQVFNSEDGELYVDLIQQRAVQASERRKSELRAESALEDAGAAPRSGSLFKQLLGRNREGGGSAANSNEVEFLEPVYVRRSRAHKSSKRGSASRAGSKQVSSH